MNAQLVKFAVIAAMVVLAGVCVYAAARFFRAWRGYSNGPHDIDPALVMPPELTGKKPAPHIELPPDRTATLAAERFIKETASLKDEEPAAPPPDTPDVVQDALIFKKSVSPASPEPEPASGPTKKTDEFKNEAERQLFSD